MVTSAPVNDSIDDDVFSRIVDAISLQGYVVINDVFSIDQLQSLFIDIKKSDGALFHTAGIGREQEYMLNQFVRRDRICWLDKSYKPTQFYLHWIEVLRTRLNRALFLGLFDYECHYAHYPKGAFYKKHLDAFNGDSNRRLSSIMYLNPAWQAGDGGELVLYSADGLTELETVLPTFGKIVIFLSEVFPHEVIATHCSRYSLTGWYRVNNTTSLNLDPAL